MTKKEKELSKQDQKLLKEARELTETFKGKGYQEYIRPFLFKLAQDGYPNPKDFKRKEDMMLPYTEKFGETNAVKKIMGYIEGGDETVKTILKKLDDTRDYQTGA